FGSYRGATVLHKNHVAQEFQKIQKQIANRMMLNFQDSDRFKSINPRYTKLARYTRLLVSIRVRMVYILKSIEALAWRINELYARAPALLIQTASVIEPKVTW